MSRAKENVKVVGTNRPTTLATRTATPESAGTTAAPQAPGGSGMTLAACFLGMFMITLDAVVVNVALPGIRASLGGGITGLQWVVDGYTLMFAALLLSSGSFSDRVGARAAFITGMAAFVTSSALCGLAPSLATLVMPGSCRARRPRC